MKDKAQIKREVAHLLLTLVLTTCTGLLVDSWGLTPTFGYRVLFGFVAGCYWALKTIKLF